MSGHVKGEKHNGRPSHLLSRLGAEFTPMTHNWTDDELSLIMRLHNDGFTDGEIVVTPWTEYGIARRPTAIRSITK